jgi:hypothetical protein
MILNKVISTVKIRGVPLAGVMYAQIYFYIRRNIKNKVPFRRGGIIKGGFCNLFR